MKKASCAFKLKEVIFMFGLARKKDVIEKLECIENNIKEWESIWSDSKDENVRITVTNTLQTINKMIRNTKNYFKGGF